MIENIIEDYEYTDILEAILTDYIVATVEKEPKDIIEFSCQYFNDLIENDKWENQLELLQQRILKNLSRTSMLSNAQSSINKIVESYSKLSSMYREHEINSKLSQLSSTNTSFINYKLKNEKIIEATKDIFLFRSLDEEELHKIITAMFRRETKPGEIIVQAGEIGDMFFAIESGVYEAFLIQNKEPICMKRYEGSGSFGEISLLYNCPRLATVVCRTNGVLWCLSGQIFKDTIVQKAKYKRNAHESFLKTVPLFLNLSEYEIHNIADAVSQRTYQSKQCIIRQDDIGDEMFIVESGTVSIVRMENTGEFELAELGPGSYFGELSLMYNTTRTASVYALTKTKVLVIDQVSFDNILKPCMKLLEENVEKYKEIVDTYYSYK